MADKKIIPVYAEGQVVAEVHHNHISGDQAINILATSHRSMLKANIEEKGYVLNYIKFCVEAGNDRIDLDDLPDHLINSDIPNDPVNHPKHYTSHPSGVECIEITRHMGFNLGNAVKYIWRDGLKDSEVPLQDLKKALWYLQDEIKLRENSK